MNDISWAPPPGHNHPPLDLAMILSVEAVRALLTDKLAPHASRCADLILADTRFAEATKDGIGTDDIAAKAIDFVRQLKAATKATDDCRKDIKAPVLAAQRQIDGEASRFIDPLEGATKRAETKVAAYLQKKEADARAQARAEAKRKQDEAERLIREAEAATAAVPVESTDSAAQASVADAVETAVAAIDAAHAAQVAAQAPAIDLSRTRTALGGVASTRQNWTFEVQDKAALLRAIVAGEASADYVSVNDAVLRAIAKSQKDKASVPGIRFFNDAGVTIR